jgi:Cdc6-like AAA superfamily ATPase
MPIAINIGTGGTPPKFLKPYQHLSWPVILCCVVVIVGVTLERRLRPKRSFSPASSGHPRNRERALANVQTRINDRLANSLSHTARIALALSESPDSVVQPMNLMVEAVTTTSDQGSSQKDITQAFEEADQALLILGAPGSGKTTMLLDLAQKLHDKAVTDSSSAVPVVVDLARWATDPLVLPTRHTHPTNASTGPTNATSQSPNTARRLTSSRREEGKFGVNTGQEHEFHRWLIRELYYLYRIPENVTEEWLKTRTLILLLDGLDEVSPSARDQCLEAINKFQIRFNVPAMAVTSRKIDYDHLKGRLTLQGAVQVQPLTRDQINQYLVTAGDGLQGVREALRQDDTLWQLLDSPLMLNIMVLAYHDRPASKVIEGTTIGDRRSRLINAYVDEVIARRNAPVARYTVGETRRWLAQLAYCASVHRSYMPLRRSWVGWHMPWFTNAPESRVRFLFSAFFPWTVGLSCSIGAVIPIAVRLGTLPALVSAVVLLAALSSYVILTFPVRRKKLARAVAYPRLRRNGVIVGVTLAASEYVSFNLLFGHELALSQVVRVVVIASALMFFLALAAGVERWVTVGLIDTLWWSAIISGCVISYLLYRWHPDLPDLTFAFSVAFITTIAIASFAVLALIAVNQSEGFRIIQRHPMDWPSIIVPAALTAFAAGIPVIRTGKLTGPVFVSAVGVSSGTVSALAAAFVLVFAVSAAVSPFKLVLAGLDLLPFRFGAFLEYAVDRSLLYKEKKGYAFIHSIFQEHFTETYRQMERVWAAGAYKQSSVPEALSAVEALDDWMLDDGRKR